jgi:hypothetical protein
MQAHMLSKHFQAFPIYFKDIFYAQSSQRLNLNRHSSTTLHNEHLRTSFRYSVEAVNITNDLVILLL